MIHLRLTCPAVLSDEVLGLIEGDPAITHVVAARGAAIDPPGDAIEFDVGRRAADRVIEALQSTGVAEQGSLVAETIDTVVDRGAGPTGRLRTRFREFPPVWSMVEARVAEGGAYPPSWFLLMMIAGVIGAVGILTNSQILIVGAMVVGPEYGAIVAFAWGVTRRDLLRVRDSSVALVVGFSLAILSAFILGISIRYLADTPRAFTAGVRPVSSFINTPNVFSFIVATVAGVVGVVSLTTARASTMIGVFISVTTIPAAADMGLSAAYGSGSEVGGSLVQLLMNVVVLTIVGMAVLVVQRRVWSRIRDDGPRPASDTGPTRDP